MNNGYVIYPSCTAATTLEAARKLAVRESKTRPVRLARIESCATRRTVAIYRDGRETGI